MTITKPIVFRFNEKAIFIFPYIVFFLWVYGAKLVLIAHFGNPTPFGDQWDGEASSLYLPWLKGHLTWPDLVAPHNEHRILTTRLFDLFLLKINGGVWDPIFQMVANALIHVLALTFLLYYLGRSLPKHLFWPLFVFIGIVYSLPFDFENTLWGFQSQWYFLLLFSFIFLWSMIRYVPFSPLWWVGFACGGLATLSLASGVVTLASGLGVLLVRWYKGKERNRPTLMAIGLISFVLIISVVMTPRIPYQEQFRAHTIHDFLKSLATTMAWPAPPFGVGLISLPLVLFLGEQLRRKVGPNDESWFVFACGLWALGQCVILSFGRANGDVLSTRYLDLYSIGLVLEFFCLLHFISRGREIGSKFALSKVATTFWIIIVIISLAKIYPGIFTTLRAQTLARMDEEVNVRAYFDTHDFALLRGKPFPQAIPYPDPSFLRSMLDNPTIANILPSNLTGRQERLDSPVSEKMTKAMLALVPHMKSYSLFNELSNKKPFSQSVSSIICEGFIDSVNGVSPPPSQLFMVNTLSVEGWMTISGAKGIVPDKVYITLVDPKGNEFYGTTRRRARPDVAKAFHHDGLWGMPEAGFFSNIDLSKFHGKYILGLSRLYRGKLENCQNFPIRINNINKKEQADLKTGSRLKRSVKTEKQS